MDSGLPLKGVCYGIIKQLQYIDYQTLIYRFEFIFSANASAEKIIFLIPLQGFLHILRGFFW